MNSATLSILWLFISIVLLLGLPGLAMGRVLLPSTSVDQQVALAPAVSISCWALLWLFATAVRLPVNTITVAAVLGAALAVLVVDSVRRWPEAWDWRAPVARSTLVLLAIALVGTALRLYWWREAVTALGSDGYHHSLISQLLIDNHGLPSSYEPYAPIASFSYHFAFHSVVASLHMITGRDAVVLTRLVGQVLSVVGLLPVYGLVRQLGGGARAGVGAVLAAMLLSAFPAFFLNWSRLTQLTALAIIPAALAVTIAILDDTRFRWRPLLLAALLVAALFTAHYLIVVFYLYGLGLLFVFKLVDRARKRSPLVRWSLRVVPLGVGALLLAALWIVRLAQRFVPQVALGTIDGSAGSGYYDVNELGISWSSYRLFLLVAALAVLALIWLRQRGALWLAAWVVLSIGYSNPYWLSPLLPGIGRLDFITALTSCYVPAAAVLGLAFERLWLVARSRTLLMSGVVGGTTLLLGAGVVLQNSLFVPSERYVQQQDMAAAQWLVDSTPADSVIMSNCFAWPWSPNYIVSADAGGWMPLLAHRATVIPPLIRNLEWVPDTGLSQRLADLCGGLSNQPDSQQVRQLLQREHISLIYLGERDGFIDPNKLIALPNYYKLVYHQDHVEIFQVVDSAP